jgi:putative hydrolase of the HAD superfamily
MLALLDVEGKACVMVEDSPRNLPPAKAVGMTTILVDGSREGRERETCEDVVDFVIEDILNVAPVVRRILTVDGERHGPLTGDGEPPPGR